MQIARLAFLAAALALVLAPSAPAGHQFIDVPNGAPFHDEIGTFKGTNITTGCTATTFCPQDPVKRQAMAAFIDRALGLVVRPGESTRNGIPGSRVEMLDDDQSFVGTSVNALAYRGPFDNVVGGHSSNSLIAGVVAGTIAGGSSNTVSGQRSAVGGGSSNTAGGGDYATVAGGLGNTASGFAATVAGGNANLASGPYSLAAGHTAQAIHAGSFVWSDTQVGAFASTAEDQFGVRAAGGVRIVGEASVSGTLVAGASNLSGCDLRLADDVCFFDEQNGTLSVRHSNGAAYVPVKASAFNVSSTRRMKKGIRPLGAGAERGLLRTRERLPLYRFRYRWDAASSRPHTGVLAERSPRAILGADGTSISLDDYVGVTVGAVKALSARNAQLERLYAAQRRQNEAQQRQIDGLRQAVTELARARG